jgi:hypothetical protein
MASNWMTPNARDWKSEVGSENNTHDKSPNLSRQVHRMQDGPTSSETDPTSPRRLLAGLIRALSAGL